MPLQLDNESELREAQAVLFNQNARSGWILLNYVGPSTIHLTTGGEGKVEELVSHLQDDQIQYAVVRIDNYVEELLPIEIGGEIQLGPAKVKIGNIENDGIRDVFINWIGNEVGIIEKGKKSAFLGDAQSYLHPFDTEVTVLNKNNLNTKTLLEKSDPTFGSHVID